MSSLIKSRVSELLTNLNKSSKVTFLVEGKEKDELINSAKKRGILIEGSKDLGVLKTIYCFTDRKNDNNDLVPSKEFRRIFPQIIGKPMNYNHQREVILGVYIDYKYILKENKAIAYSTFFKSIFPELYQKAKKLKKEGKLSSSFEIWSPEEKRTYSSNGTCTLHNMEIAGGGLIFEENGVVPAFRDAKVLSIAKKIIPKCVDNRCLVLASKYKDSDIIIADIYKEQVEKNLRELNEEEKTEIPKKEEKPKEEVKVEAPKEEDKPKEEVVKPKEEEKVEIPKELEVIVNPKIKCSNCEEEFEVINGQLEYKCPKCFSILDTKGAVKYPPQIKDFKLFSLPCGDSNYLIIENKDDRLILKCQNEACNKTYEIEFAQEVKNELLDKTCFLYTNTVSCIQCGTFVDISGTSQAKSHEVKCPKCKLTFVYNKLNAKKDKQITKITEIIKDDSSKKGGDKEVDKHDEKDKLEEKKEEKTKPKEEVKVEAPKEEDKPKEEAVKPKEEEKVEIPLEKEKEEEPKVKASLEIPEESSEEVKEVSTIRRAVKKILTLKKELKIAKTEKEEKDKFLKTAIKKVASQLITANAKIKKIKLEADKKIELYKTNAKEILKRRGELGEKFVGDLSDKDILDDDKFKTASLEKKVTLLTASKNKTDEIIGDKTDEDEFSEDKVLANEIDAKAYKNEEKENE